MGFAVGAIAKFKAHKDNPTQVPLSTPIVLLFVATALIFIPAIYQVSGSGPIDPRATPSPINASVLLSIVTPILQEAKTAGFTRETSRASLLPSNAIERIRAALQAHGLSGQALDATAQLAQLIAEAIVAGARA
jgi:hypothetical protein